MLGVAATLICDKVRTYIERELRGVGRAAGEDSADIDLIAFMLLTVENIISYQIKYHLSLHNNQE